MAQAPPPAIGSNACPTVGSDGTDVVVGYMTNPSNPSNTLVSTPVGVLPNAVQVTVQRTSAQNGQVPFFFAKAMGYNQVSMSAQATAAV